MVVFFLTFFPTSNHLFLIVFTTYLCPFVAIVVGIAVVVVVAAVTAVAVVAVVVAVVIS